MNRRFGFKIILPSLFICIVSALHADEKTATMKTSMPLLVPHNKFSQDCGSCHIAKRWDVLRPDFHFDHAKETGYALEGAHASAKCVLCHNDRGPVQAYAIRGCGGCHVDPHNKTMGMDCLRCHDQVSWQLKGILSEHARTTFPLTGMHTTLQCVQCHPQAEIKKFSGAPSECFPCHQSDYQKAPNHVTMNFPTTCENCHTTTSFASAKFSHSFLTNQSDCYSCHSADYVAAPQHTAFNFPHTCGTCHTTSTWLGATFNHSFLGNVSNCFNCHQTDFSRGPNHVAKNYPHDCSICHNTTSFANSTFVHTFPLTSNHNVSCDICHQGGDTSTYTCLVCHAHDKSTMDQRHASVPSYQYNSVSCVQCHPGG